MVESHSLLVVDQHHARIKQRRKWQKAKMQKEK